EYALDHPVLGDELESLIHSERAVWINIAAPRRIRVTTEFKTPTGYTLVPGEYLTTDPHLFGLVGVLLATDRAGWVDGVPTPSGSLPTPTDPLILPLLDWCPIPSFVTSR